MLAHQSTCCNVSIFTEVVPPSDNEIESDEEVADDHHAGSGHEDVTNNVSTEHQITNADSPAHNQPGQATPQMGYSSLMSTPG